MTLPTTLMDRAQALSEFYRPPRWRVFSYWTWKRHHQPADVARAMAAGIRGEYAPLRQYGIALSAKTLPQRPLEDERRLDRALEIGKQTRRLTP